jgi:predicted nucleic acid-binding protein
VDTEPLRNHGERADEVAKNALEEDINDLELYLPQDLINEKKNKKGGHREKTPWDSEKITMEWKDDSTNLSRKEQVMVSSLRTGYTNNT